MKSSFKKTALASVVAGTLTAGAAIPQAEADVIYVDWKGAFTMLNPGGAAFLSLGSDYASGYYANGDNAGTVGTPQYPGNVNYSPSFWGAPYATGPYAGGAMGTAYGWYGWRTPVSGTMAFDLTTGAGVGTANPFFFFGDQPTGLGSVANALGITFATVDTVGTIVGSMLFSWNGGQHSVSIVLDASGMFGSMNSLMGGGPTNTISGVGALPASENTTFGTVSKTSTGFTLPLGPSPIATKTTNALGCEALTLATMVNAYTIVRNNANIAMCDMSTDDGIGGSPMVSTAFSNHNANFDVRKVHFDSFVATPTTVIPVPAAVWLFGSGLLGLVGIARRKKKA
jgi:hypothetical protein